MNNIHLQSIIDKKKTCYFISPHFDDAILSAGSLLSYLSHYTKVIVINIFTTSGDTDSTLSAKAFLKQCKYTDQKKLFADREKEDEIVLRGKADKIINLGFTDALWRKKYSMDFLANLFKNIPEFQVIYPTYRLHIIKGKIAKQDVTTLHLLKKELASIIKSNDDSVIFCPFGIGGHIDHIITRKACEEFNIANLIYWSDFPYNEKNEANLDGYTSFSFETDDEKRRLIEGYGTQYQALFPSGLVLQSEKFLVASR